MRCKVTRQRYDTTLAKLLSQVGQCRPIGGGTYIVFDLSSIGRNCISHGTPARGWQRVKCLAKLSTFKIKFFFHSRDYVISLRRFSSEKQMSFEQISGSGSLRLPWTFKQRITQRVSFGIPSIRGTALYRANLVAAWRYFWY